jgi:hypothetical protein
VEPFIEKERLHGGGVRVRGAAGGLSTNEVGVKGGCCSDCWLVMVIMILGGRAGGM